MLPISTQDLEYTSAYTYRLSLIRSRNKLIKKLANEFSVTLIDFHDNFEKEKDNLLDKDGLHPNNNGHEWLAQHMEPFFVES